MTDFADVPADSRGDSGIDTEPFDTMKCGRCGGMIDIRGGEAFAPVSCPMCGAEGTIPARFAKFVLLNQIGTGGMGAVYRALDPALDRIVGLKVLLRSIGRDPASVEAFQKEAKAAARLNHPCVAHIYAFGVEKGQPYIAMEFLEGKSLIDQIETQGALDEAAALRIALHTAMGLHAAWKEGLVHADVKPHNILFDKDGRAKLIDFGLAMFAHDNSPTEGVWGSPYYMAPERIRRERVDLRTDMYGLGASLYHALAGRVPYEGDDVASVAKAKLRREVVPPSRYRRGLLPETDRIVCRLLRRDPSERYPTYESLENDLQKTMEKASARPRSAVASPRRKGDGGGLGDAVRRFGAFTSRFLRGELDPVDESKPAAHPMTTRQRRAVAAAGPHTTRHRPVTTAHSAPGILPGTARHSTTTITPQEAPSSPLPWIVGSLLAVVVVVGIVVGVSQSRSSRSRPLYAPPPSNTGRGGMTTVIPSVTPTTTTVPVSFVPPLPPRNLRTYSEDDLSLCAKDDTNTVVPDAETTLRILQNDDWSGTRVPVLLSATQPSHGTARMVNQAIAYKPEPGYLGEDSFRYTVQYGTNRTSTATVTLHVAKGSSVVGFAAPALTPDQHGLLGRYYDNQNFTHLKVTRVDPAVDFNWGEGARPAPSMGAQTFSIRWTGQVEAPVSETYTFYTVSDDGVRLWVNGVQIVNNWKAHPPKENSGTIALTAGQKVKLKMEYFQGEGGAVARLLWSSPSMQKQVVPTSQLYLPATNAPSAPVTNAPGVPPPARVPVRPAARDSGGGAGGVM